MKEYLELLLNKKIFHLEQSPISGGSINEVYKLTIDRSQVLCCKINDAEKFPGMFETEKAGLDLLRSKATIRVPAVLGVTTIETKQVLVMEWIKQGRSSENFWKLFGKQLSQLHEVGNDVYGLDYNNYMGALRQSNNPSGDWNQFFYNERIRPQVKLAADRGRLNAEQIKKFEPLPSRFQTIFQDVQPSLLHGDLWSGNYLCDDSGKPVLIDPAVYFGSSSVDMGLTTLFGGYDHTFYDAYNYYRPFISNYKEQWEMCNLYPLLIHLNLFGKSYLPGIIEILDKYQ